MTTRLPLALLAVLLSAGCSPSADPAEDAGTAAQPPAMHPLPELDVAVQRGIASARERVAETPADGEAWGQLAMGYHAADLLSMAREAYAYAGLLAPAEPKWPYLTGLTHDQNGDSEAALAAWDEALGRTANAADVYPPLHWRMGAARLALGEWEAAEVSLQAALDVAPEAPDSWFGMARLHLQRDEPEAARDAATKGLELDANHGLIRGAYGRALLGRALQALGQWDEAQRELERAGDAGPVYLDPWQDEVFNQFGESFRLRWLTATTLLERGDFRTALPFLEALHGDFPEHPTVAKLLASTASQADRPEIAEPLFETLLAEHPGDRELRVEWTQHCLRTGNLDAAETALTSLLTDHPEDGRSHFLRGRLAERLGRADEAVAAYRTSLFHDQRNPGTLLGIGRIELERREWSAAHASYSKAIALGADSAQAHLGLGLAAARLGRLDEARTARDRARSKGAKASDLRRVERAIERAENETE